MPKTAAAMCDAQIVSLATKANKIVFVVICKTEHFVRNNVTDVNDQVPFFLHGHRVQVDRNFPICNTVGNLGHFGRGNRSNAGNGFTPIMSVDSIVRDVTEHPLVFSFRMRDMLTERWDNMSIATWREQFVKCFGNPTGPRCEHGLDLAEEEGLA